jgi:hypothetical protein
VAVIEFLAGWLLIAWLFGIIYLLWHGFLALGTRFGGSHRLWRERQRRGADDSGEAAGRSPVPSGPSLVPPGAKRAYGLL